LGQAGEQPTTCTRIRVILLEQTDPRIEKRSCV
jgi:hypothetical protein